MGWRLPMMALIGSDETKDFQAAKSDAASFHAFGRFEWVTKY